MNIRVDPSLWALLKDAEAVMAYREGGFATLHLKNTDEAHEIFRQLEDKNMLSAEHLQANQSVAHGLVVANMKDDIEVPGDPIRPSRVRAINNRGFILSEEGVKLIEEWKGIPIAREPREVKNALDAIARESKAPGFISPG